MVVYNTMKSFPFYFKAPDVLLFPFQEILNILYKCIWLKITLETMAFERKHNKLIFYGYKFHQLLRELEKKHVK